jgi:hypothetical protein
MTKDGGTPVARSDVQDLLETASRAPAAEWVETYRDALAALGDPAIDGVLPWLADSRLGAYGVGVIERAGREFGHRPAAVRALRAARRDERNKANWRYIDGALERLGSHGPPPPVPPPVVPLPPGMVVAPAYAVIHHVIEDHVAESATTWGDIYLFYCGRFFSGRWVRSHGGVLDAHGRAICAQCAGAIAGGR